MWITFFLLRVERLLEKGLQLLYVDYSKTKDLLFFTQNLSRSMLIKHYAYIKNIHETLLKFYYEAQNKIEVSP